MLLHLILDCANSHSIDGIELIDGHELNSAFITSSDKTKKLTGCNDHSDFSDDFGMWFKLLLIDWVSVNCSTRQLEWALNGKDGLELIKYVEDESFNIDMDELFVHSQLLIHKISEGASSYVEQHTALMQLLYYRLLPQIRIFKEDTPLVVKAITKQEGSLAEINEVLNTWNCENQALKATLSNLRMEIVHDFISHPHMKTLYPELLAMIKSHIHAHIDKLNSQLLSISGEGKQFFLKSEMTEMQQVLSDLNKPGKKFRLNAWVKKYNWLIEEKEPFHEKYLMATERLAQVRKITADQMRAKVKIIQVKEAMRIVKLELKNKSATLGFDIQTSGPTDSHVDSHHSVYDSVQALVNDPTCEIGLLHLQESNEIIELCTVTLLQWEEDPSKIPSNFNMSKCIHESFEILDDIDIFTSIAERISVHCARCAGLLHKQLPRFGASAANTRKLLLTYQSIIYRRLAPSILRLMTLQHASVVERLCKGITLLTWDDLQVEEEWLKMLLVNDQPVDRRSDSGYEDSPHHCDDSSYNIDTQQRILSLETAQESEGVSYRTIEKKTLRPVGMIASTPSDDFGISPVDIEITSESVFNEADNLPQTCTPTVATAAAENPSRVIRPNELSLETLVSGSLISGRSPPAEALSGETTCTKGSFMAAGSSIEVSTVPGKPHKEEPSVPGGPIALEKTHREEPSVPGGPTEELLIAPEEPHKRDPSVPEEIPIVPEEPHKEELYVPEGQMAPEEPHREEPSVPEGPTEDLLIEPEEPHKKDPSVPEGLPEEIPIVPEEPRKKDPSVPEEPHKKESSVLEEPHTEKRSVLAKNPPGKVIEVEPQLKEHHEHDPAESDVFNLLEDAFICLDEPQSTGQNTECDYPSTMQTDPVIHPIIVNDRHLTHDAPRQVRPYSAELLVPETSNLSRNKRSQSQGTGRRFKQRSQGSGRRRYDVSVDRMKSKGDSSAETKDLGSPRLPLRYLTQQEAIEVVVKRRSMREFKPPSVPTTVNRSSSWVKENTFTGLFHESIQCLENMQLQSSPVEKGQLLAKCLRCMATSVSKLMEKETQQASSSADDLVTIAIVMLKSLSKETLGSVYVQLQFISTYLDEFMESGIHSFACVQFIGAFQFILDLIVTRHLAARKLSS